MIRTTKITLKIKWNDKEWSDPADWDWAALLDLPDENDVVVLDRHTQENWEAENRDWYRSLDN